MNRRSFFATLFGGLLCKFLPKRKIPLDPTRIDTLDLSKWGRAILGEPEPGTWASLKRTTYPGKLKVPR